MDFKSLPAVDDLAIATLGPAGTSSERSAVSFGEQAVARWMAERFTVLLCDSYEEAGRQVLTGRCHALVVANAYAGIDHFYMDRDMQLSSAFLQDTPLYGIVSRKGRLSGGLTIATHPAPRALIAQLLPEDAHAETVVFKDSTSFAAQAVAEGEVDAALTTEVAAGLYGLRFVSPSRPIRMLWSVFVLNARGKRCRT